MCGSQQKECPVCSKLLHRAAFQRHLKRIHGYDEEQCQEMKESSEEGGQQTKIRHIICPLCEKKQASNEELAMHCAAIHLEDGADGEPQNYDVFFRSFSSEEEYQQWLTAECERNCTTFYQKSSRKVKSGTKRRLWCNRAGVYKPNGSTKEKSTRRVVSHCSCFLNVYFRTNGAVDVKGCFGHVGHALEPALLRLSAQQQEYLTHLMKNYTFDEVLQRIREEERENKSRLYYTTRDDLWNLTKRLQAQMCSASRKNSDKSPVSDHVEETEENLLSLQNEHQQVTDALYCRAERYHKLNEILNVYGTIEMQARLLAECDSDEALQRLNKILEFVTQAAAVEPIAVAEHPVITGVELLKQEAEPCLQDEVPQKQRKLKRVPKTEEDSPEPCYKIRCVPCAEEVDADISGTVNECAL